MKSCDVPVKALGLVSVFGLAAVVLPAGAALGATSTSPQLVGGAHGTLAHVTISGQVYSHDGPVVIIPPNGGKLSATAPPYTWGGYAPYYPPTFSVGSSQVTTDGTPMQKGVAHPIVNATSQVNGFVVRELGFNLSEVDSKCTADDAPGAPSDRATSNVFGTVGNVSFSGTPAPNTTSTVTVPATSTQPAQTYTIVLNEQVHGLSPDGYPGILVNAVHIYQGAKPAVYTTSNSVIVGDSHCEVDDNPPPPGIIPESPIAASVAPASALALVGLGGTAVVWTRRRRRTE